MRPCLAAFRMTLAAFLLVGCASTHPAVVQFGVMSDVMREGHTEARLRLADAVARPHAFGVGALEGLAGEITIVDGDVWVSRVADGGLDVTGPDPDDGDRATLLTLDYVATWQSVTVEKPVEGPEVESLIERTARERGIDTTRPFPFVLEGEAAGLDLHAINGYCPIAIDPATVEPQPWLWSSTRPTRVVIVGFFAPNSGGVMTHHGTSIHAHAILSIGGRTITAHVDRVSVTPGMTLRVPAAS